MKQRGRFLCLLAILCLALGLCAPALSNEAGDLNTYARAHFTRSFSVYTGPGTGYFRAEFVNGWASYWWDYSGVAKVWGVENGWLMIGFNVNGGRTCVGYISAEALQCADQVSGTLDQPLTWLNQPAYIASGGAPITDDPERDHERFAYLTAGQSVTVLGYYGTWVYVEANVATTIRARGFVRSSSVIFSGSAPVTPRPTVTPAPVTARPTVNPWPTWAPVTQAPTAYVWPTWTPVTPRPTAYVWPTYVPVTARPTATPFVWPTWAPPTQVPYPTWAPAITPSPTPRTYPTWAPVTARPTAAPTAIPYTTSTLLASLSHNCPNTGEMLPAAFSPYQRSYVLTVASWVTNVCFTPTAYDPTAYITVNGQYVASGRPSSYITLTDAPRQVDIVVRSGYNTNTYTVFLQRRPSETDTQVHVGSISTITQSGGSYYLMCDLVNVQYYGNDYSLGSRSPYSNPAATLSRYVISPNCDLWYGSVNGAMHADDLMVFMANYRVSWGSGMYYIIVLDDEVVAILPYEAESSGPLGAPYPASTPTPRPTVAPGSQNRLHN